MTQLALLRFQDLHDRGASDRRIRSGVRDGSLVRVRPGWYVSGREWRAATPERRTVARAQALVAASRNPPVFSHETAAAAHGLPLFSPDPARVHITLPPERPGAAQGVVRHRGDLRDDEIEDVDGMLCTTLLRTIADIARTASFEQAVTVADAALHRRFAVRPGSYDRAGAAEFTEAVRSIARRSAHGVGRAERVLAFADGRAQLPGESISRIRLAEAGFAPIDLQREVAAPGRGRHYYVDFAFDGLGVFGEFDGAMKYVDGKLVDGRTTAAIFDAEKQREDWIRGTTRRVFVRWGWPHVRTAATLSARLAAFGVLPAR